MEPVVYAIVGIVLVGAEIFVPGFVLAPFGIASLLTAGVAYLLPQLSVQLGFLIVTSVLLFFSLRKLYKKFVLNGKSQDVFGVVGQKAIVTKVPVSVFSPGACKLFSEEYEIEWKESSEQKVLLENLRVGDIVQIRSISGNKVSVEPI